MQKKKSLAKSLSNTYWGGLRRMEKNEVGTIKSKVDLIRVAKVLSVNPKILKDTLEKIEKAVKMVKAQGAKDSIQEARYNRLLESLKGKKT